MRGVDTRLVRSGDVWLVQFDPVIGHEQAGRRPAIVVSGDDYHRVQLGLATFVPITSQGRGWASYVPVTGPSTGLHRSSFALADQIRTMSVDRMDRRLGNVDTNTLAAIRSYLRDLLEL